MDNWCDRSTEQRSRELAMIIGDVFGGGENDADHQKGVVRRCKMARSKVQGVADFWQDRNKWMVDYWQDRCEEVVDYC